MLSADIIKKIRSIHIKSSRLVDAMMAGQYKSVFRGTGMEFEEVREYAPGDEVKSIDWKVSARMGRPYIKLYKEERERVMMLLIDMSASTRFGTTDALKREKAAEIAGILAFNAIRSNDRVGAIFFSDQVELYIPPKKGASHIWRVIREIFTFEPVRSGTDIAEAVRFMGNVCRKRNIVFLISDFLDNGFQGPLKIAARKHEIINVLLTDPGDFRLPVGGIMTLEDFETGRMICLDALSRATRERFETIVANRFKSIVEGQSAGGFDSLRIQTDDDVAETLKKYFRFREKRGR